MLYPRSVLLGAAVGAVIGVVSCGARDSVTRVENDAGIAAPHGGFTTTNTEETFSGTGAWDFGVSDGMHGKPCDPEATEACGDGLLCCRITRDLNACTVPIRTGECPKIPSGPSGGKSTNKTPGQPPPA